MSEIQNEVPSIEESIEFSDGYQCLYRHFSTVDTDPSNQPKAILVAIHGIQSHDGWYHKSCSYYRDNGYETYFLNRRGSGPNQQDRGDSPSLKRILDDLSEFIGHLKNRHPDLPVYLMAISWGAKPAITTIARDQELVDGVIFLCPGWFAQVKPPRKTRLGIAASLLFNSSKRFEIPLNDPELFTQTPRWITFMQQDERSLRTATARLLWYSFRFDFIIRRIKSKVRTPSLLILAEHDRIIDNEKTRQYFDSLPAREKEVLFYPGAHHTLEFEDDPQPIFEDIIKWLNRRVDASKGQGV